MFAAAAVVAWVAYIPSAAPVEAQEVAPAVAADEVYSVSSALTAPAAESALQAFLYVFAWPRDSLLRTIYIMCPCPGLLALQEHLLKRHNNTLTLLLPFLPPSKEGESCL